MSRISQKGDSSHFCKSPQQSEAETNKEKLQLSLLLQSCYHQPLNRQLLLNPLYINNHATGENLVRYGEEFTQIQQKLKEPAIY